MPEHTIAENLARLQAAKTAIGNAIVAKGGTVNSGDGLEEYPTDIASIENAELTSISITENGVYSSVDAEEVESSNLPIVIEADGTPLLDYLISGDMVQTGTPTPQNPIQPSETGERTGNEWNVTLLSNSSITSENYWEKYDSSTASTTMYMSCEANTTYYLYTPSSITSGIFRVYTSTSDTIPRLGNRIPVYEKTRSSSPISTFKFTTGANDKMLIVQVTTANSQTMADDAVLDKGYKIPISSASTTTTVYLGDVETTRKIKKLVLTGTEENWIGHGAIKSWYQLTIDDVIIDNLELCTHYKPSTHSASGIENGEILAINQSDSNSGRIIIKDTNCARKADFLAYLAAQYAAGTPVTVWYVLATEETGIVNEPLRKIGNYADTLSMEQAGVQIPTNTSPSATTIDIPTTLPPSLLYVEYNTLSTTSGYNYVDVNVPNTYSSSDEGKVVSNRQLIPQIAKPDTITANNTYDTTNYNSVTVDVENSYTASDEGKVVSNGALVSQTAKPTEITVNDTYDTTTYNSVTVDVANTYTQSDEGKVVSNGELVAQTTKPDVIVKNGAYDTTLYNSVNVNVSSEPQKRKDVNFYDYDGTIVKSYTAAEFANISELPDNPSHEGLTSQGWNWSLADAKAYVAKYGKLEIGQMYITDDGKTRIYITLTEGRTSPILQLYLKANSKLDIDWGDGSHSTFTSTTAEYKSERHNYATAGSYVIAITVITGSFVLQSSSTALSSILWNGNYDTSSPDKAYNNSIKKIEIGTGITSIGDYAFYECYLLQYITIPDGVTSIGDYAFSKCRSLSFVTIGNSVTSICEGAFFDCSLSSITIPNSVTSIGIGIWSLCYSLSSITIPDSVTSISDIAFSGSLLSLTIPDSVTSIGNEVFDTSCSLSSITISNSVTSIGDYAFRNCYSLSSITIPDSVTSIGNGAFYYCSYIESIKFTSATPPTVSSSNAWYQLPTSCIIYVPAGTLDAYKRATNYPSPSTYTYVEY